MKKEMKKKKRPTIGQYISGNVLSNDDFIRRLPVLGYIGLLMLLYMANGFRVQAKYNRINQLSAQIKELRTTSVTTSAVRMSTSRQSQIEKLIKEHNIPLEYTTAPPKIIQ